MMSRSRSQGTEVTIVTGAFYFILYKLRSLGVEHHITNVRYSSNYILVNKDVAYIS